MGILDEAIREHLELKRQHGAEESELKQLEDEAFGQAERPGGEAASDAMAEAPTEFMAQPDAPEEPAGRREPTIADLQEPPPPPAPPPTPEPEEEPAAEEPPAADEPPPEEEQPAMEHEIVADIPEPAEAEADVVEPEPSDPTPEERQAIAEQPTELFEIEADEEAEVTVQGPAPDDDEEYEDEDDAFWNEQRLSDELDQALEGPSDSDPVVIEEPDSGEEVLPVPEDREPASDEEPETDDEPGPQSPADRDDVLDETPDFLEEAPEDDQLWFEQKPPKDFDFDD